MKKVLITGATGFIGQFALEPLRELGFEVHAVSSRSVPGEQENGVIWHRADLLQPQDVARVTAGVRASHLLHLAWYVEHGKFWDAPENDLWVEASKGLFDQFVANGGKRVVAAGTCAEYDWKTGERIFSEATSPIAPASRYGRAKDDLHKYLAGVAERAGISYAWGRIFYLFGPGESKGRFIPMAIRTILRGETFTCNSPADAKDFVYVKDVAAAFAHILTSDVKGAVNIASGTAVRLDILVQQITDLSESGRFAEHSRSDAKGIALVGNHYRLVSEAGFARWTDPETALTETIDWWRELQERNS